MKDLKLAKDTQDANHIIHEVKTELVSLIDSAKTLQEPNLSAAAEKLETVLNTKEHVPVQSVVTAIFDYLKICEKIFCHEEILDKLSEPELAVLADNLETVSQHIHQIANKH